MIRNSNVQIQDYEIRHIQTVRNIAPECTVLLKNENVLPLGKSGKIALYGSGGRRTQKGGTGSGDMTVRYFPTIEEGLKNAGFEITTEDWLNGYEDVMSRARAAWTEEVRKQAEKLGVDLFLYTMGKVMPEPEYELPLNGDGDTAVYVLSRISGEGSDRTAAAGDICLSETEIRDILAVNDKYEKFILILNVGGMVDLTPVLSVKCILLLGQLGITTGDTCADLFLGKKVPSGKLAMTWAPLKSYPSTEGFGDMNDTRYREGVYVGYRYFDSFGVKPTFPFGFGLSYTDFTLTGKDFSADERKVRVTVSVKNTGQFCGKEVVQVYFSAPQGFLDKPFQVLAGFAKTRELFPGEEEEVTVCFDTPSMASYVTSKSAYMMEQGDYIIRVGNSSACTKVCGIVRLDRDVVTCRLKNICPDVDFEDRKPDISESKRNDGETVSGQLFSEIDRISAPIAHIFAGKIEKATVIYEDSDSNTKLTSRDPVDWTDVKSGKYTIDDFIAGLSKEQLADLSLGNYGQGDIFNVIGNSCTSIAGGSGETTRFLKDMHLDVLTMSDGPAGLRISPVYKMDGDRPRSCVIEPTGTDTDFIGEETVKMIEQMTAESQTQTSEKKKSEEIMYYQYCTAIPTGSGLAQSFNEKICEECGDLVGDEMERFGVHLWLAPAMNIQRSPLCGRNFEYFSEDPLLSGKIAAAITRGVQKHSGRGATVKHYAANNQETNRMASNSMVSERALREIYLKSFEICIKESHPEALMTSNNLVNGVHTCNSRDLLTTVLKDEWGFDGIVMTDWYVTSNLFWDSRSIHSWASAAGCVKAGNHLCMSGMPGDREDILKALEDENHPYHLTIVDLQKNAKTVLRSILRLSI